MDFSWVKQLAEQSNMTAELKFQKERADKTQQRQLALATTPFVEKLHRVLETCAEEFNKYIQYQHLRCYAGKLQKRAQGVANANDAQLTYQEESASFQLTRGDWIYGVRGTDGVVEFLELPTTAGSTFSIRLEETGVTPSRKLIASLEKETEQIVWLRDGQIMDGQAIVALCRDYFREFIERSNEQF